VKITYQQHTTILAERNRNTTGKQQKWLDFVSYLWEHYRRKCERTCHGTWIAVSTCVLWIYLSYYVPFWAKFTLHHEPWGRLAA